MKAAMGFRLAQPDLTLDDLEGSKTKVTVFYVKCVENGKTYDVGPNEHDLRSHRQQQPGPLSKIFGLLVILCKFNICTVLTTLLQHCKQYIITYRLAVATE